MKKNRFLVLINIVLFISLILGFGYVQAESRPLGTEKSSNIIGRNFEGDLSSGFDSKPNNIIDRTKLQLKESDDSPIDNSESNLKPLNNIPLLSQNLQIDPDDAVDPPTVPEGENYPLKTEDGRERREDGVWYINDNLQNSLDESSNSGRAIQGPDQYGYVWEDAYPYSWIDVSGGIDTGIDNNIEYAGPINIGFDFKFYTNSYSQLYIARNGYISFNNTNLVNLSSYIPDPELPNDVIAPMWGPAESINYVHYQNLGDAPDRQMIIEWNQQASDFGTEVYTFQLILHENGDIVFQYNSITGDGSRNCTSSGIEDGDGLDGLTLKDMCEMFGPGEAARIYRPDPGARISLLPEGQSGFIRMNSALEYPLTIKNLGDLGPDVFDMEITSDWAVDLYASDGTTSLTDTNGNGMVDTGPVAVGEIFDCVVGVTPPLDAGVGDTNAMIIEVTSSLDANVFRESTISMAYPTNFAQSFFDADTGAGVYLVHPNLQIESLPDSWSPSMGVVETANGNLIYAANIQRYDSNLDSWITDLERTVFDNYGNLIRYSEPLASISPSEFDVWELGPAVAAAPNGNVGILWYRYTIDDATSARVDNIFFAILDETGELVYGPEMLTNNTTMGVCWEEDNIPCYDRPQIAVTGDGKFAIAYQELIGESSVRYYDVYFGLRNSDGSEFTSLTNLTRGLSLSTSNTNPTLSAVNGDEFFLAWNSGGISYTVINSAGVETQPVTSITTNMNLSDSIQLSDGKIFLAGYDGSIYDENEVNYLVLDNISYDIAVPVTSLVNPHSSVGNSFISVTKDQNARAILTWNGNDSQDLYYSLIASDGTVITAPFVLRSSNSIFMDTSETGYGNTTYSTEITPFTGCDDVTAIPVDECYALQALYDATDGDHWSNNQGWFELANPSTWYGISVTEGHVSAISLNSNDLNGTIPAALGDLSYLTNLNLSWNNNLSGSIPPELGALNNLTILSLNGNELSGSIPEELCALLNLRILNLGSNQLSDSIPIGIGDLINLQSLFLYMNELDGPIPAELGQLANLEYLNLFGNKFYGSTIPEELGNLTKLISLDLYGNGLVGSIPASFGDLTNLTYIGLRFNGLEGNIPPELGNLTNLETLDLFVNNLDGGIPSNLGSLANLKFLYLSANELTGEIPVELGNLTNLIWLELGGNHLSGTIPYQFGALSNLMRLQMGNNELTGPIPEELGYLTNLQELSLGSNHLTGDVPESLVNLVNLCTPEDSCYGLWDSYGLDLSYNYLNVPAAEPPASFLVEKDPDWYLTQAQEEDISGESGGTIVSNDENTQIEVPPDAVTGEVSFVYEPEPYPSQNTGNLSTAGISFHLTAEDSLGNPITTFNEPLLITLDYNEAELGDIPEEELYLYYWDEGLVAWVDVVTTCGSGEYQRDLEANWLSVPICHLSEFALMYQSSDLNNQVFLPLILR